MRRLFVVVSLLTILVGCSATMPVIPTPIETPRPTVTPLGKGSIDVRAMPAIVVTQEVPVTRVVLVTVTPAPTLVTPAPTVTITPKPTPLPPPSPTPTADYSSSWVSIDSMMVPRSWHSATVLLDGRVLITGGYTALDQDTASVEVFDPATDTFSPTGSLNTARHEHSATLLPDGRVLVIAGYALGWLSSAEIYNPASGQWTLTQPLFPHGVCHTATLLQDGRVLVMAGAIQSGSSSPDDRVEIFDSTTNRWQAAARHENTEGCHSATRLLDGRVLIAGGHADPTIYDPVTNAWSPAGTLTTARLEPQAALLPDGRVLLIGGIDLRRTTVLNSAEVYDPAGNAWQLAAPMLQPRFEHTATMLPDGRVLVVGGWQDIDGYENVLLNTAEIYDYKSGSWNTLTPLGFGHVRFTTTLLPDGRIFVIGGETRRGTMLSSAEVLEPR